MSALSDKNTDTDRTSMGDKKDTKSPQNTSQNTAVTSPQQGTTSSTPTASPAGKRVCIRTVALGLGMTTYINDSKPKDPPKPI